MNKALIVSQKNVESPKSGTKPQRTRSCAEKYGIKSLVNQYLEHSAPSAPSAVKKPYLLVLNLLKKENTTKADIAAKRKKAGWDNDYLLEVLSGF